MATAQDLDRTDATVLDPQILTPAQELAILARALFRTGWDDFDTGHITYRMEDDTFLTVPLERGWDELTASDIVRIDKDAKKIDGRWSPMSALALHTEFHRLRPGVSLAVHQHPRFVTIWSATGRIPQAYDQRGASLAPGEIVYYDDYRGSVSDRSAAEDAVTAMGESNIAILRNHGAFVVGNSIGQVFSRCVAFEWRCRQAWYVEAIGGDRTLPEHGQADITGIMRRLRDEMPNLWNYAVRREIRADAGVLL